MEKFVSSYNGYLKDKEHERELGSYLFISNNRSSGRWVTHKAGK